MKASSLKKNVLLNLLYQVFIVITPFITAPYLSRVLGADGIGIYSYTNSIQSFFSLFAILGTTSYGVREIARCRDDEELLSKTFWEIELLLLLTTGFSLIFWFVFVCFVQNYKIFFFIYSINFFAIIFDISWLYAGLEQFQYTIKRNIIFKSLGIIAIFLFVKNKDDLLKYIIISLTSNCLGNISMWIYLRKFIHKISFKKLAIQKHFKETLIYFIPTVSTSVYTILDKALIGIITQDEFQNGYYEQVTKIIDIAKSLAVYSVTGVLGSRMSYLFKNGTEIEIKSMISKTMDYILLFTIGLFAGMLAIADFFVPVFFGPGYDMVVPLMRLMSPIVLIVGISNCIGALYYVPAGLRGKSSIFIVIGAITNLILNLILIPKFQSIGAALGSIIAEAIIAVLYIIFCKGYFSIKLWLKCAIKKIIAAIVMVVELNLVSKLLPISVISLLILVISGIIVYFVMLLILHDCILFESIRNICRRKNEKN